jgi:DNA-directed RNA polymerase specialized sigma24 family protein
MDTTYIVVDKDTEQQMSLVLLRDATMRIDALRGNIQHLADERTVAVRRLRDEGYTYSDIAAYIGVTPQAVAKMARRRTND